MTTRGFAFLVSMFSFSLMVACSSQPRPAVPPLGAGAASELGFEAGPTPVGWMVGGDGYQETIDASMPRSGHASLKITKVADGPTDAFGVATRTLPAEAWRGKRIHLTGSVKAAEVVGWAALWMRVDGVDGPLEFDNMRDRPIVGTSDWKAYDVELDVPKEATAIYFGAFLAGEGSIWVDDFRTEAKSPEASELALAGRVVDAAGAPVAAARVALVSPAGSRPSATSTTDAHGRFHFVTHPGRWALTATTATGAAYRAMEKLATPRDDLELELVASPVVIHGRLLDDAGKPWARVALDVVRFSHDEGDVFETETDDDGSYSIGLVPGDGYRLLANVEGALPMGLEEVPAEGGRHDVTIARRTPASEAAVAAMRADAVPLATVEAGHGFDDLRGLDALVGDAHLVALGEATHGTREFFQMKHRLLEWLVAEKGFTVFAIEANFPEVLAVDDYVRTGRGDPEKALAGLYFWTWDTAEVLDQIRWMRHWNETHERQVRFTGFDMQYTGVAAPQLFDYLDRVDAEWGGRARQELAMLGGNVTPQVWKGLDESKRASIRSDLDSLLAKFDAEKAAWSAATTPREWTVARQEAVILEQAVDGYATDDWTHRDRAMAANVDWLLANESPGTRIVLWAHNGHISRAGYGGRPDSSMGSVLARVHGRDYVAIGFTFDRGGFQAVNGTGQGGGRVKPFEVGPSPADLVGAAFARTGLPLFALDLRDLPASDPAARWLAHPRARREIGAVFSGEDQMERVGTLSDEFDGVIFVAQTTHARAIVERTETASTVAEKK